MGKMIKHNSSVAICHNGKIYPPMMATICNARHGKYGMDVEYVKRLGESGIKIYFLICDTEWIVKDAFDKLDEQARILFDAVPDALIVLRIGLHPSNEWMLENLEECIKLSDGSFPTDRLITESYTTDVPACYTLYSKKWRETAAEYLKDTYHRIKQKPYADRIIGAFLAAGNTSEWRQLGPLNLPEENLYADFSESMKREFELYLRETYGTEENLRKAWQDETATFTDFKVPTLEERYYTMDNRYDPFGVDHDVKFANREDGRPLPEEFYTNPTHIGSFLNIEKYKSVYDFYRARAVATSRSFIHLAKTVRELDDEWLVGAFYGNFGCTHYYNHTAATATHDIIKSGLVDMFAAPPVYQNRQRGGFDGQRCINDSMRLHSALFVSEDDVRTHFEIPEMRQSFDLYTVEDSIDVLKRSFGRNICDDTQGWWFDQHFKGGRYKHEKIYELFARQSEIAEQSYSLDRAKGHEIAFIYDEESINMVSPKTTHDTIEYMRNYEISRIGAGVDLYYHNDILHPDMPDYKLYVFFNTYYLTDRERVDIKKKLAKNNATAVFMYANGIMNPDAQNVFSPDNMSDLLGMKMEMDIKITTPIFRVCSDHPATACMDKGRSYGDLDRQFMPNLVEVGYDEVGNYERSYLSPCVYPKENEGEVVATFCETGKPALTIKENDGYTAIHLGTKVVRAEVLRSIAKYAGCHIYSDSDDVLFQNKHYVVIHASSEGEKTLKLPKKCSPVEVYENKCYGTNTDVIKFNMRFGETKMFFLGE